MTQHPDPDLCHALRFAALALESAAKAIACGERPAGIVDALLARAAEARAALDQATGASAAPAVEEQPDLRLWDNYAPDSYYRVLGDGDEVHITLDDEDDVWELAILHEDSPTGLPDFFPTLAGAVAAGNEIVEISYTAADEEKDTDE